MPERPRHVQSYIAGAWRTGMGEGRLVRDAATGEPVALVDATGIDRALAVRHAREVGGPALRAMTFQARAAMLKALAGALEAAKAALHEESFTTGATAADARFDIDGGIHTLSAYASRGRRELPDRPFLLDGPAEGLARDHSFAAGHILTPRPGVAVHINAFNFPCWGMLEKLAPTWLAGMPAIVKAATPSAHLAEKVVRRLLEAGVLPEGALQFLAGEAGDLLDHLGPADVLTFTGSRETGLRLKTHPVIAREAVRFNMEADSLNAAILAPDAAPGSPEFDLFIREVSRELTIKAGQRCTAIRRILVPRARLGAVREALAATLGTIRPGLPSDPATRLGALISLAQREEVRRAIRSLATEAEIVLGDPDRVEVASGDPERGAFLNPVLLLARDPGRARLVHEVEAFGPVATLMPYEGVEEALHLAARGGGSLVASVFTDDAELAARFVHGLAPWHGRILIGNRRSAKSGTGHGSPLPGLVHGGPGRAGGGEELGGLRALHLYLQRTAVQAAPALLSAVSGRFVEGAEVREEGHPFRRSLAGLRIGDRIETPYRTVTLEDIEHFAHFTGDTFYAHLDEAAARAHPFFRGRVAHGYLVLSFAAGLFVDPAPGPVLANAGLEGLRFHAPLYPGDAMKVRLTCKEINRRAGAAWGEVRWACEIFNQRGEMIASYDLLTMVAAE